jgi:nucleotide-binding universal stress UspA family protein
VYEKILVPLDGSELAEAALPGVEELGSKLPAEVTLVQVLVQGYHNITAKGYGYVVYPEQQMESDKSTATDYLEKIGSRLQSKGVTVKIEVRYGNPAEQIIRLADEIKADMVAMSTHGRSGVNRLAFGSVAEKVLRGGNTQVLLTRPPQPH